jgi:pimeloyl-ACP methyl ester carboxylesterase
MAERYPIVFFPGVMGSRLRFESSDQYWDPDNTWRMLRWAPVWPFRSDDDNRREWHAREPAGVLIDPLDDSVDAEGVDHGWGGVVWSSYGTYLQHLRSLAAGRQAFAVGYDWRQDIRWLGEYAADKLRACLEQTGAEKLWLVSHSMGGLVVRSAFLSAPDLVHRIDKVLHVCQPSTGAVILYRRLFTGLVRGLDGGGGVSDRAFRLLLGDSRAAFVGNMSGQPGPLQLLPSESFPADEEGQPWNGALAGTPFAGLYGNADSPPGLDDGNLQLPAEARDDLVERIQDVADFFAWLGAPRRPDLVPPETWLIYGTGRDTETRITFADGTPQPVVTEDGDGTVPSLSATALGLAADRQFAVAGLGHATACQDGRVRELTSQVF